jgi:hypothetical protein
MANASGAWSVGNLPAGTYQYSITQNGVGVASGSFTISAGQVGNQGPCKLNNPGGGGIGGGDFGGGGLNTSSTTTGFIVGLVTDANSKPIPGAVVITGTDLSRTNAAGQYGLAGLAAGNYTVQAAATGYQSASATATVTAQLTTTLNFQLTAGSGSATVTPATVSGTVTDVNSTNPISGATLTLGGGTQTTSASDGTFSFTNVTPGVLALNVQATGYQPLLLPLIVNSGATLTVPVTLAPVPTAPTSTTATGTLTVTVTDSTTSNPIVGALVHIDHAPPFFTNSSGVASVSSVPVGQHNLVVLAPGYVTVKDVVTITSGNTTTAAESLQPVTQVVGFGGQGGGGGQLPGGFQQGPGGGSGQ